MITSIKYWQLDPVIISLIILLCIFYFFLIRGRKKAKVWSFFIALLLIILCTCSPLHWIGMHYLFSAHMVSHITLFLIAPPLLILSIPSDKPSITNTGLVKISKIIARMPWLAWILGIGIMWFWHIPDIFNAAMPAMQSGMSGILYHAQSISLIMVGLMFWWPVLGPVSRYRIPAMKGILYLFTACISCSLLGMLITFAPVGIYTYYAAIPDSYGFTPLIRNGWGITAGMDQQMAGLIMWVPGCLIYLSAALYLLRDWFMEKDEFTLITSV